jgi:hypothetical protein
MNRRVKLIISMENASSQDRFQAQGFASTPRPTYIADGSAVQLLSVIQL